MSEEFVEPNNQPQKQEKKKKKPKGYFLEDQENAFVQYITSTNKMEKDKIFRTILYPALTKMIESIIRRYGLFVPSETFEDTFNDCMSFLITKVNNYDVSKGFKVYSYCGTIAKNYLILRRTQDMKKRDNTLSYDTMFPNSSEKDDRVADDNDTIYHTFHNKLIEKTIKQVEKKTQEGNTLSDNERKIGFALLTILRNWEDIFRQFNSKKFNKASVYLFIRELTQLTTKEIREGLKVYKDLYFLTKQDYIDLGD